MPFSGPETVVGPPPLVAPPTGLLQAATIIEHPLLQTAGNLAYLVGPDAPDTILASAILDAADEMLGRMRPDLEDEAYKKARVDRVQGLTETELEDLRLVTADALTAAAMGGMELGGDGSDADPLDHWAAGIRWLPEPHLGLELVDPCTDAGHIMSTFGGSRVITDGVTATDTSLVSLTAHFTSLDVGRNVSGAGIFAGSTIVSVTNDRTVVLSHVTTATATGVTILIAPTGGGTGASRKSPVSGQPFLAVLHDSCSTFGWQQADYVGRARRGLAPRETIAVEQEFMHGLLMGAGRTVTDATTNTDTSLVSATIGFSPDDVGRTVTGSGVNGADIAAGTTILSVTNATTAVLSKATLGSHVTSVTVTLGSLAGGSNRYLADQNVDVYGTGAVDPKPIQALAYANEIIARSGIGQGMIHVSAFFAEVASALGYTFKTDSRGRLVTLNGNIVVPGNGYDGVGPDGTGGSADDGANDSGHTHEWIYVSDMPIIWRPPTVNVFPASLREATNRAQNEVTFRAERPYIIEWSALLQAAIKVNVLG